MNFDEWYDPARLRPLTPKQRLLAAWQAGAFINVGNGVARLRAENDGLREMLKRLQWREDVYGFEVCRVCGEEEHAPDCALAALLKGGEE